MPDIEITEEGVRYDLPEDVYHRDPVKGGSLSYSGAKKLLAEGGPELFAYEREHPPAPSAEMELGTAAHKLVLGVGQEVLVVQAKDWKTKAAQQMRDEAREAGKLPLLAAQMDTVHAMAAKLREHEWASKLLGQAGRPEASAFWQDPDTNLWWRCRWDKMPEPDPARRPVLADYKTCADASPTGFAKAAANYRYYMQASVYTAGYNCVFGTRIGAPAAFVLIAQEAKAPYRVACYELHPAALRKGREDAARAMAIYAECTETGHWPGYSPGIELLDLPYWAYREDSY